MEEQPFGNGRAERGKVKSSQLAKEEQKCGNGRATIWHWKSNQLAMEEQRGERYKVAS